MTNVRLCKSCGRPLVDDGLEGVCASCMFGWVMGEPASDPQPSTLDPQPSLLNIPGYEIREEIARGGMGIVYRARQKDPRRTVALKMLLPHQVASPEMVERFRLEARAIATLEHPAILPVHHVGEHDGLPFFTMKLATGGTLAQRKAQFAGDWRAIAELMATLADAVQFAHERGVLHRDLKPGNVLFDDQDRPYVSDFGLAKLVGAESNLTRSVDFLGTPHYVAPEVATRSAKDATTSSDIYALGAILYELLAGRPPFEADGMPALLKMIAEEEPKKFTIYDLRFTSESAEGRANRKSKIVNAVPRDLEVICLKCLAKEPARRYATALELANDLRRWLAGEPILARETNVIEKLWLWSRRHRVTATLIAAVFVLLVALVVGLSFAAVRIADSRQHALHTVEALEAEKANDLFAAGNTAEAIALLARRVRNDPDNWADTSRLMWALQRRRWAVPARAPFYPFAQTTNTADRTFLAKGSDQRLLEVFVGKELIVYDVAAATNRHVWPLPFLPERFALEEQPGVLVFADTNGQAWCFEYLTGRMREQRLTVASVYGRPPVWLSQDGRKAFVVARDYSGELVDFDTHAARTLVAAPTNSSSVSHFPFGDFFPDNRRLAFSDRDQTVRIFDCEAGVLTGPTFIASQRVIGADISPDNRVMVTHTSDATQFWDVESGRELSARSEVGVSFRHGSFRPDGAQFYQAGNAFGLVISDPLKGEISKMPARGTLLNGQCIADPAGRRVAARFERFVGIYDAQTGQPLCQPLPVVHTPNRPIRFADDLCVTVGSDGRVTLWEVKTNRFGPVILRHSAAVQYARFSNDGQRVVTASHDGTARVWDANTGEPVGAPLVHGDKVWSACFSPDGRRVATASWDATARLWDAATGAPLTAPLRGNIYLFHVAFSPDGSRLLTCGEDGNVRTYAVNTGKPLLELTHQSPVYWARFSPDGRTIVTRPMVANPKLWNADMGQVILELDEPGTHQRIGGVVTSGDFSRDGSWLALGSPNRYATVWHLPDGKLHAVLNHVAVVRTATFSPDSRTILTTADDLTGQLWDLKTGKAMSSPLAGQRSSSAPAATGNSMRAAAIHSDGRRAIIGGSDAAARLWNLQNGLPLGEPAEFDGSVMHAEFSPDGKRVLLACFDGTAQILPLPPVVERAPDWLAPLAEALVGQRFDERGAVESVPTVTLWEICGRIRQSPADDELSRWPRDFLGL